VQWAKWTGQPLRLRTRLILEVGLAAGDGRRGPLSQQRKPSRDDTSAVRSHWEFLEGREQLRLVPLGLQELPERSRTIFILSRLEHMKQYEIARLGINVLGSAWD
jgi:DNA-directed RNA polymerase specialized sigma24 family protein